MSFSQCNFGQLLHELDTVDTKHKIRFYEKIKKRILLTNYGIHFNQLCLNEGLYPIFTNIYVYIYIYNVANYGYCKTTYILSSTQRYKFRRIELVAQSWRSCWEHSASRGNLCPPDFRHVHITSIELRSFSLPHMLAICSPMNIECTLISHQLTCSSSPPAMMQRSEHACC